MPCKIHVMGFELQQKLTDNKPSWSREDTLWKCTLMNKSQQESMIEYKVILQSKCTNDHQKTTVHKTFTEIILDMTFIARHQSAESVSLSWIYILYLYPESIFCICIPEDEDCFYHLDGLWRQEKENNFEEKTPKKQRSKPLQSISWKLK